MDIDEQLHDTGIQHITPRGVEGGRLTFVQATPGRKYRLEPLLLLLGMLVAMLFLDAVLPLGGLWFATALLGHPGSWPLLPTRLLFSGVAVSSSITSSRPTAPAVGLSWRQVPLLLLAFLLVFLPYVLALWRLPRLLNNNAYRYIFYSTALLGLIYILFPVVTSRDIYSYIVYARMGVIYHLNPLTTLPTAIATDPVYVHLYWKTQPSAYGPTWAAITCALQWLALPFGSQALRPMIMALRISGLASHLCSTLLIWSIIGQLQRLQGQFSPARRTLATLAFAWNPLVLLETCVNAHNDAELLLLILLAIWLLLPRKSAISSLLAAMVMLALATCLKVNVVVLLPLVVIFVWKQAKGMQGVRLAALSVLVTATAGLVYTGVITLLYAPFWQQGAILHIFSTNPSTYRNINTPAEFFSRMYNSISAALGHPLPSAAALPAEPFIHKLSIGIFVVIYAWFCWQAMRRRDRLQSVPSLICWLSVAWFLYCIIGTPWFWPWYLLTFFGLGALIAGTSSAKALRLLMMATSLLAFSMLSIYCFYAWGPQASYIPGLPHFQWAYLRGLWVWSLPLLTFLGLLILRPRQALHTRRLPERPQD